jgi:hypothetical protein
MGRQEGEAKGRQDGEAKGTLRLLTRRCCPLTGASIAQNRALPVDQLEALADALLDFQAPADLAAHSPAACEYRPLVLPGVPERS